MPFDSTNVYVIRFVMLIVSSFFFIIIRDAVFVVCVVLCCLLSFCYFIIIFFSVRIANTLSATIDWQYACTTAMEMARRAQQIILFFIVCVLS